MRKAILITSRPSSTSSSASAKATGASSTRSRATKSTEPGPLRRARALAAALAAICATGALAAEEPRLIWTGTGAVTGVYYPVGVSLCRIINQHRPAHGYRCVARPSAGTTDNLERLLSGEFDLAIVQTDAQAAASDELRAVMALHPEPLTIVTRRDAGIATLADLAGRRVNIGPADLAQRRMLDALFAGLGWDDATFAERRELPTPEAIDALCAGEIDAFLVSLGHPALAVQEATATCDTTLVPAEGGAVEALLANSPYYTAATIPGGLYQGAPDDIPTFGVGAMLVTRADAPEEVIELVVGGLLDEFATFTGLEPALRQLDPEGLATRGVTAPLHPGAARAYSTRGIATN